MVTKELEVANALIDSASIRTDEGRTEVFLTLGYNTALKQGASLKVEQIGRLLEIARVKNFKQLEGRAIRVQREVGWSGLVRRLGDIIEDQWLDV